MNDPTRVFPITVKPTPLEHWCQAGDLLQVIKSCDEGLEVTALYNERTKRLYIVATRPVDGGGG